MLPQEEFLKKLESEAALQAKLERRQLLPRKLDRVTSFIGRYPWQVLLVLSGICSAAIEVIKYLSV